MQLARKKEKFRFSEPNRKPQIIFTMVSCFNLSFISLLFFTSKVPRVLSVGCDADATCSCNDPLLDASISSCTNDGFCTGDVQTVGCSSNAAATDCPWGWPVNEDVSGDCFLGWDEKFKCGKCAAGHEDKRVAACFTCKQWGVTVYSTCETEQRCAPCEPGEYAQNEASTECFECPLGKQSYDEFISKTEMTSRFNAASPMEKLSLFGGATQCVSCIAGKYSEETGELLCDFCKGNKYSGVEASECLYCEPGSQANNFDPTALDSSESLFGSTGCVECPAGKFSRPSTNTVGCVSCNSHVDFGLGYSSDAGAHICYPCPVGRYTEDGVCTDCPAGKYGEDEGQSICTSCSLFANGDPAHQSWISEPGQADCEGCKGGTIAIENTCQNCTLGKYSTFSDTVCTSCFVRQPEYSFTSGVGAAECVACPSGKYSPMSTDTSEASLCVDCEAGYGYYQTDGAPRSHTLGCLPCPKGQISQGGDSGCSYCPAGKFETATTSNVCINCPAGRFMGEGDQLSNECFPCLPGTRSDAAAGACTPCPANTYESDNVCHDCPDTPDSSRTVASEGSVACTYCSIGKAEVNGVCVICPAGKHASSSQGCKDCEAGKFNPSQQQPVCVYCIAGWYSGTGAASCSMCGAGTKTLGFGAPCVNCEAGKTSNSLRTTCVPCGGGTFNPSAGSAGCIDCAAGKYAPVDETSAGK